MIAPPLEEPFSIQRWLVAPVRPVGPLSEPGAKLARDLLQIGGSRDAAAGVLRNAALA